VYHVPFSGLTVRHLRLEVLSHPCPCRLVRCSSAQRPGVHGRGPARARLRCSDLLAGIVATGLGALEACLHPFSTLRRGHPGQSRLQSDSPLSSEYATLACPRTCSPMLFFGEVDEPRHARHPPPGGRPERRGRRWLSRAAGTTFAGTGFSPAGTTELFTSRLDQFTGRHSQSVTPRLMLR
jgi:hypothetical protein